MAQKVIVELVDDIDGTVVANGQGETIGFAIDGVGYTIDLGAKNAKTFRKTLDRYVSHATPTDTRRRPRVGSHSSQPRRQHGESRAIREWAHANGYDLAARGRIPVHIEQAYRAAT